MMQHSRAGKLYELESLIQERFIGEADTTRMEDAAAEAMVVALGDRWSYYIPAAEYETYQEQMSNSYVGIGITIVKQEDGFLIQTVSEGGPAQETGLLPGDILIQIEGQAAKDLTAADTRNLVRGPEGTAVSVTVLRDGTEYAFSVPRRKLETAVATGNMIASDVGLVTITNFDSRSADESIAAVESLMEQGAKKLIFDVRNNPGGYAAELVALLDYLLPEGELFHTVDYRGREEVDRSDANCLEVPMAVLVNGNSYSAAEFFAAALMDYDAAVIVGEQTCGKGYFQTTIRLSDGSAVGLSVGKYFTPGGKSLADVGITPDIPVSVDAETSAAILAGIIEPENDPQLQAAIDALK